MPTTETWAYRTVRVGRDAQGNDIVIGDSTGNPATHGHINTYLAAYLDMLGREGWEALGSFGHIGAAGSGGYNSDPEVTILLKRRG